MEHLYLNGSFLDGNAHAISVEDRGFQFADGIYEVVRVYNGRPFRLEQHLARLRRSAEGIELTLDKTNWKDVCQELIRRNDKKEATIYIQVTRGSAPRTHTWDDLPPTVLAYLREFTPRDRRKGWSVITVPDDRWGHCNLKTIALLPNVLARQKARKAGCEEAIFVRNGFVLEATTGNIFVVKSDSITTPPADHQILAGITRDALLEIEPGIDQKPLSGDNLMHADEVFLTGTTTEVTSVVEIDGQRIGDGMPGSVSKRLAEHFRDLRQRECTG